VTHVVMLPTENPLEALMEPLQTAPVCTTTMRRPFRLAARLMPGQPQLLTRAVEGLVLRLQHDHHGSVEVKHVTAFMAHTLALLGLPRPRDQSLYLVASAHDSCGINALSSDALEACLCSFLEECIQLLPEEVINYSPASSPPVSPPGTPRQPMLTRGPSAPLPSETVLVSIRTLAGEVRNVAIGASATTQDLRAALARTTFGETRLNGEFRFAAGKLMLRDGEALLSQGIEEGTFVDAVRVTPPPRFVRLGSDGFSCGPSIRGSCGTFCLAEPTKLKNGRPMYVRDHNRSQWNQAMQYHGAGNRYLLYEEHPIWGGRWALTDDQDWVGYDDRSFAFVTGDAPHPGYLEGLDWCVYRDAHWQAKREWVAHSSLRLSVEEEDAN